MKRSRETSEADDRSVLPDWNEKTKVKYTPNGKTKGKSAERYNCYAKAKTAGEALSLGASKADIAWDYKKGLLQFVGLTAQQKLGKRTRGPAMPMASTPATLRGLKSVKNPAAATSLGDGIKLASGMILPVAGFGTYKMKKGTAVGPVLEALKAGYRLIDTAQVYENEGDVGQALRESGLSRADVCIETKHWRSSHGYERTMQAFRQSLRKLGTDYVDLYVIHWPGAKTGWPLPRGQVAPKDWTPAMRDTGTWRAMEDLYDEGKIKAIGVTNYSIRHLKLLIKQCRIKPMVNQVEFHPRLVQSGLLDFCKKEGIQVQAYASLGSSDSGQQEDFFDLPPVRAAAEAHGKTPAQVLLRWALEKGTLVIPKSTKPHRMKENAGIFDFKLSAKQVASIDALNENKRFAWKGLDPDTVE